MGYSPPARKLAVSPDNATRLGSARLRAMPFCSSALSATLADMPPFARLAIKNPYGAAPEITPAAATPAAEVMGRPAAGTALPTLILGLAKVFHCTPSSRPAVR